MNKIHSIRTVIIGITLSFFLLSVCIFLQWRIQQHATQHHDAFDFKIQNPDQLKKIIPSRYHSVMADLYWIRFIQYHLEHMDKTASIKKIMRLIVTLDPHLPSVYAYTARNFLFIHPRMPPPDPKQALEILDEGIRAKPDYWPFYIDKAFLIALYFHDYPLAQQILYQATLMKNAPSEMGEVSIYMALRNKNYPLIHKVLTWQKHHDPTERSMKHIALVEAWLQSIQDRDALLNWAKQVFLGKIHYPVNPWFYLGNEIHLPGVSFISAKDFLGYPYLIKEKGEVVLHPFSPLYQLDQEYQALYVSLEKINQLKAREKGRKYQHESH